MSKRVIEQAQAANKAKHHIAALSSEQKNIILQKIAEQLDSNRKDIILANQQDVTLAKKSRLNEALIDRLTILDKHIDAMIHSLNQIQMLKDPCGNILDTIHHKNTMVIQKVSVPIGVIAIIYESRPNVTIDAAALCIKSGNCVILKGGKEAINTNRVLYDVIIQAIIKTKNNNSIVQFIDSSNRNDTLELLQQDKYIDVIIPRGGTGLINFIHQNTKIAVLKHLHGICHTYIDQDANVDMASSIIINAKCQRPGVCNAIETLLVHKNIAKILYAKLVPLFISNNVELRVCKYTESILKKIDATDRNRLKVSLADETDWHTEYLDLILSVKTVEDICMATDHINTYGSHHSDAIITDNASTAESFLNIIDSAVVYHNASTRFTDGEEFGMGAEMGISTDKLHARGPVGLKELTTYKYKIYGNGQIRE